MLFLERDTPRATGDLDIRIDRMASKAVRVWSALVAFGAPVGAIGVSEADRLCAVSERRVLLPILETEKPGEGFQPFRSRITRQPHGAPGAMEPSAANSHGDQLTAVEHMLRNPPRHDRNADPGFRKLEETLSLLCP